MVVLGITGAWLAAILLILVFFRGAFGSHCDDT